MPRCGNSQFLQLLYYERMFSLKKFACLLICCCFISLGTVTAFAKESTVRVPEEQITLEETQTAFEAVIEVVPENTYAGVEIGIAWPEGVGVTDSSASSGSMSAGPVFANGLYWTSFFESENKLSGSMKITLQLSCPQDFENGKINIQQVKLLTKEGASVVTETLNPIDIQVVRYNSNNQDNTNQPAQTGDANTPNETPNTGSEEIPSTGDDSSFLWIAILLASAAVVIGIITIFSKKNIKQQ